MCPQCREPIVLVGAVALPGSALHPSVAANEVAGRGTAEKYPSDADRSVGSTPTVGPSPAIRSGDSSKRMGPAESVASTRDAVARAVSHGGLTSAALGLSLGTSTDLARVLGIRGDFGAKAATVVAIIRATLDAHDIRQHELATHAEARHGPPPQTTPLNHGRSTSSCRVLHGQRSEKSPPPRFLVFSQWDDVLHLLAHALQANGVSFLLAGSAKALRPASAAFEAQDTKDWTVVDRVACTRRLDSQGDRRPRQRDKSIDHIDVLLMSTTRAAAGLNLSAANHVIFVEQLLEPAMSSQAAGRIHRMGQSRPCFVHTLVAEDSVEQSAVRVHAARQAEAAGSNWLPGDVRANESRMRVADLLELLRQQRA